jgi:hypothetical protein
VQPLIRPTIQPSSQPSYQPIFHPSKQPSIQPSNQPSSQPSDQPTVQPSVQPTYQPISQPSSQPSNQPSTQPEQKPSAQPSCKPTVQPSVQPSNEPSFQPCSQPSIQPYLKPSCQPTLQPTGQPTLKPFVPPTKKPTIQPSHEPSKPPSIQPTSQPSQRPSKQPFTYPTLNPSNQPTMQPSPCPSRQPTENPSSQIIIFPSIQPSRQPSNQPTAVPSSPSTQPTKFPSVVPSRYPSCKPSFSPSDQPSSCPTILNIPPFIVKKLYYTAANITLVKVINSNVLPKSSIEIFVGLSFEKTSLVYCGAFNNLNITPTTHPRIDIDIISQNFFSYSYNRRATVTISGLQASTIYIVFCMTVNLNGFWMPVSSIFQNKDIIVTKCCKEINLLVEKYFSKIDPSTAAVSLYIDFPPSNFINISLFAIQYQNSSSRVIVLYPSFLNIRSNSAILMPQYFELKNDMLCGAWQIFVNISGSSVGEYFVSYTNGRTIIALCKEELPNSKSYFG